MKWWMVPRDRGFEFEPRSLGGEKGPPEVIVHGALRKSRRAHRGRD